MPKHRFHIVDVFGESKYSGNQLAVVLPGGPLAQADMQAIAREFNFPETTFLGSLTAKGGAKGGAKRGANQGAKRGGYHVRIFTPRKEVPFAGHPTLGTAFVIRNHVASRKPPVIALDLGVGRIPVRFVPGEPGLAWMRQPAPVFGPIHARAAAAALVGLSSRDLDSRFPAQEVSTGMEFLLLPVKSLEAMRRASADRAACQAHFAKRPGGELPLFLFCPETYDPAHALNARMFADAFGIPEDPATGSANGCLAAYLGRYRYFGSGEVGVVVEQGYEIGRPSLLRISATEGKQGPEIEVGGRVIEVAEGRLL
jgi:trans-2,3-dihydro-3-hydroxyanthranilate isomerase